MNTSDNLSASLLPQAPTPVAPPPAPIAQPRKRWKIIVIMVVIFLCGLVSGVVMTAGSVGKLLMQAINFEHWPERTVKDYRRDLHLTPPQVEKIRGVLEKYRPEMLQARNEAIYKFVGVMNRVNADVKAELTPEQAVKFEMLNKQRGDKFRKDLKLDSTGK